MRLPILFGDVDSFGAATSWAYNGYFDPPLTWDYIPFGLSHLLFGRIFYSKHPVRGRLKPILLSLT